MDSCLESPTAYLRIAAISIALYDALWTIPAEIAIYRDQKSFKRMTRACMLFILIRYTSIFNIVLSNVGFFAYSFTEDSCTKFYLISPALKGVQTMISQAIVAVRTIAVARQSRWVVWTVGTLFVVSVVIEFFSNLWRRVPFREPDGFPRTNCTSGNVKGYKVAWIHYLMAMLYDATCLAIASGYIFVQNRGRSSGSIDQLSKMLLKEGLLYFCFLTAVNVLNLILYIINSEQGQSAASTLGYAITWIMSQRLIIHLQEFKGGVRSRSRSASHTKPPKTGFPHFLTPRTPANNVEEVELGVHVTVEESVKVDYDQDITEGVGSQHRITTARIEKEHQRRKDRKKQKVRDREDEESFEERRGTDGKGWEITSVGKIFS